MKKNRKNQTYTSQKQNYFVLRPNPIFYGNRKIEDEIMVIEDHPKKQPRTTGWYGFRTQNMLGLFRILNLKKN